MQQSWPYFVRNTEDSYNKGYASLPHSLWLELCVKHSQLRFKSAIKLVTKDAVYIVHPLPAPTIHQSHIELYSPSFCKQGGDDQMQEGQCGIGQVWSVLASASRLYFSESSREGELYGRIIWKGCQFTDIPNMAIDVESDEPVEVDPSTVLNLKLKGEVSMDKFKFIDDGAFRHVEEIVVAVQKGYKNIPRGILLSGPPGVGKTHLIRVLCQRHQVPLVVINGSELVSPLMGQSESNLRQIYGEAERKATEIGCCVLFMDEVDSIGGKRGTGMRDQSQVRLLGQLLTLLDGVDRTADRLVVIAATNRPNSIDPALRRPGRFDREIVINPPDATLREKILEGMLDEFPLSTKSLLSSLGKRTIGYVAADLSLLCREISMACISSRVQVIDETIINIAMSKVTPSLIREYRVAVEEGLDWDSLGGISSIKDELQRAIEWPLQYPEAFVRLGLQLPRGVLLHGPPGCSKTTIAKILACRGSFSFYSLSGAAIFSAYVGEAERMIREVFTSARHSAPSLIFFDEIDALVGIRGAESTDVVQERVLATFLNEMDGIESLGRVLVLAATNRLNAIDPALLRPGRFDRIVHIPTPNRDDRLDILRTLSRNMPLSNSVDLEIIASKTEGFSGADLKKILQESALMAIRRCHDCILAEDIVYM